ncbi:hypothetical protein HII30_13950 [Paenibacillus lemnae]|uniref:DUF2207 domain-containing protein n=1 Tax=Paenibacillus lemnae TaxID=1330551 RepID=A0A848MBQ5_PAELE|nr:hypothetical protein [Paenibacillus lemnae]NMO96864.1 hypothetical protein [Paenibacillus lemnae]
MRTQIIIFWTFVALAALGIILNLSDSRFYIPVIIVAVVFLLYKFPPGRLKLRRKIKPSKKTQAKWKSMQSSTRKSASPNSPRKKQYPFQVIEGQKGKHDPSDDVPKYH